MTLISVQELTFQKQESKFLTTTPDSFELGPINFEVEAGETLAVVGENGSGKSLLAKLLVGLDKPSSGRILLNGHDLQNSNLKQKCHDIRMIFQNTNESLNPSLTLATILDEPLRLNTQLTQVERNQKIDQTLKQVGLMEDHKFFYRHMLSDGQKQRVALARAIILDPKLIVADEPFAALDPSVRSQTVNLLMRLQRELGLSFIFISHNLGIVRHISDKVIVMKKGKVVETGKTDVIFNWPKDDYTKKLVEAHQNLINHHND
ncbi:ATP-binding cassette domain-containing protein [Paraglaciecola aquimarina]|uniref:ATP-binding cassette domain-containing protein n=1 Tax=Paraglaciecola aquimarina TaxID=1235557 RepID=A0ABU3T041_9ALTE|nr:ATP-binding cassette domain-containing protein [Paraglaciecola aquimarina]MDU0355611.1 ATP-binding cassette domain-containing protein [Paraglaciecola aquimarina]